MAFKLNVQMIFVYCSPLSVGFDPANTFVCVCALHVVR